MAFQVTPDTDVAEAVMFHGALVTLGSNQGLVTGSNTKVAVDTVEYDTDGFWVSGSSRFVIPSGVEFVRVGGAASSFGAAGDEFELWIIHNDGSSKRFAQGNAHLPSFARASATITSYVVPVSEDDYFELYIRRTGGSGSLQGNNANYPNYFWLEVIKTPFGRPDSPTLP